MTRTEIIRAKEIMRGLRLVSCLREHIQNAVRWPDIQECVKTGGPATCLSVRRLRGHCQQGVKSGLPVKIQGSTVWYKNKAASCVKASQGHSKTNVHHTYDSDRPCCTDKYHVIIHASCFSLWNVTDVLNRNCTTATNLGTVQLCPLFKFHYKHITFSLLCPSPGSLCRFPRCLQNKACTQL